METCSLVRRSTPTQMLDGVVVRLRRDHHYSIVSAEPLPQEGGGSVAGNLSTESCNTSHRGP